MSMEMDFNTLCPHPGCKSFVQNRKDLIEESETVFGESAVVDESIFDIWGIGLFEILKIRLISVYR
jgi:hypothetical protein